MVTPLFALERVCLTRDGTDILRDISLDVAAEGITVLVGASGAGKSTLLRCLNRLESPTSGTIRFRGDDLRTLDPLAHRRRVAMVFQAPTAFPGTVADNLRAVAPRLSDGEAGDLLRRVSLDPGLLHRFADALSGGEAQRMVLARALTTEPEVLLADEATSALDATATTRLETLARAVATDGMPVLWVTHDLAQARRLADHLVVTQAGRVTWTGTGADPAAARRRWKPPCASPSRRRGRPPESPTGLPSPRGRTGPPAPGGAPGGPGEPHRGGAVNDAVVGWGALGASLLFVALSLDLTGRLHLGLDRPIVVGVGRSLVQMAIVGTALVPIVDPDTPLVWSWVWVVAIIAFSAATVARRAPQVPGLLGVAAVAMGLIAVTGLGFVYGLGIFPLQGRTLVPVAGMVIGNSMKAAVVGAARVAEAIADHRPRSRPDWLWG